MTALDLWQAFKVKCQEELGVLNIFLAVCLQRGESAVYIYFRNYDRSKSHLAALPKPVTLMNQLPPTPK